MYGMVHRVLRQMVLDQVGPEAWHDIERKTQAGPNEMISVVVYDDALTYQIFGAVAERLELSLPEFMDKFGRFWITYTDNKAFRSILNFAGTDLVSLLRNLDRMHATVLAAMPQARVPSFKVVEEKDGKILLRYQSQRQGLTPFICGLLHGLLERFELEGTVEVVGGEGNAIDFLVTHRQRALVT